MTKENFEKFLLKEGWERNKLGYDWAYLQNYSEYIWDYIIINYNEDYVVKYIYNDTNDEESFKTYKDFMVFYKNKW
jgi:hypothetical protein